MSESVCVVVCGGRTFRPTLEWREWLVAALTSLKAEVVVSGCAKGADEFGESVAYQMGLPVVRFPAQWSTHGRAAGPIRNQQMAEHVGSEGYVIALPGGVGTASMMSRGRRVGATVFDASEPVCRVVANG